MSKLTFREELILQEVRDPSLKYAEKFKGKAPDKVLDKVILTLEGNPSGVMSRLTKRYERLDRALKAMTKIRNELNEKTKGVVADLFNAEDVLYTRVVETCSFTITLSKAIPASEKEAKVSVDYEAICSELEKLIDVELLPRVEEIKQAYTKTVPPEDSPASLRVKSKLEEGVGDVWKKFRAAVTKLTKSLTSWAVSYDKKLAALKKKAGVA